MKKIISSMMVFVLLVGAIFTLVSCANTLSGTYEGMLFDLSFSGNEVSVSANDKTLTGTYKISETENGEKTISFDFVDEDKASGDEKYILGIIDAFLNGEIPMSEKDGTLTLGSGFAASQFKKK